MFFFIKNDKMILEKKNINNNCKIVREKKQHKKGEK